MPTSRLGALRTTAGALHDLLNVSTLTDVATGGVHHGQAPPNTVADYVVIQAPMAESWDAMQSPGEETFVQIAAVTLKPDYGSALAIIALVIQLVDGERPTITGHLCVACQWQRTQTFREPELVNGVPAWRAVATFRLLVDQT